MAMPSPLDGHGVDLLAFEIDLGGTHGGHRTGGDGQRDFAELVSPLVVDHGRFAVDAHEADVGAVHGAAHVDAAGEGDAQGRRQTHAGELVEHGVHDDLHRAGGVGGRGVAVQPALGVDHVGDASAGAANGEPVGAGVELHAVELGFQGLGLGLVVAHELNVGAGRPADVAAAVLVGDVADHADGGNGHRTGASAADGEDFVAGLSHVHEKAGLEDFMVGPFAKVLGNDRREHFIVFVGADIGDAAFHGFLGIVPRRNKSHFSFSP